MASFPIIDSHMHLYAASHIPRLSWTADLAPDHALNRQNSVEQYREATCNSPTLRGFVFLETDRKSSLKDGDWHDPLEEVSFLLRIANGSPIQDEGHVQEDKSLVLAIIPWAPVPAGSESLAKYVQEVKILCDKFPQGRSSVKGFRYLLQDKAPGTMLQLSFIDGLSWLAESGFTFDLGVDARSGGLHQLREACEMLDRAKDSGPLPKIVINHLCKPNLRLATQEVLGGHPDFTEWKDCVERMASFNSTYMKLSGLFSELPPQKEGHPTEVDELVLHTKPWVDVVFGAFGPTRIMFGSDWPVCNVGGPGIKESWSHWVALVTAILEDQSLTEQARARIWAGTAAEAYNIS